MITGEQLIELTDAEVDAMAGEGAFEVFLAERDIDPDAVKALVRYHGSELVDGTDVLGVVVRAVILGFVAGYTAHDAQVAA